MNQNDVSIDRVLLKERAKLVIKENYWKCFLAALILQIAVSGDTAMKISSGFGKLNTYYYSNFYGRHMFLGLLFIIPIAIFFVLLGIAISLVVTRLVMAPLEVGGRRFFLEASQRRYNLGEIGFGFSKNFFNVFKTILIKDVFVMLWYLVLIIPGIVKGLAYSMVPYIMAENPDMNYKRAIEISDSMTKGYKWQIFVFKLSFIGWFILGTLLFGIGTLFVFPYYEAANTEVYLFLRARALSMGIVNINELSK